MIIHPAPGRVEYRPRLPAQYRPGIGIIGCGNIVKSAHLPAYNKYGLKVVGVYDPSPAATWGVTERFGVRRVFSSLDELLSHPDVAVVDIATHPDQRIALIHQALEAGKHVLAQKPLAPDMAGAREVVAEAQRRGLMLAVNQNGRWAPPWRIATLLVQHGVIGDVLAVTHLYDKGFNWAPGSPFDALAHCAIYDYSIHWIDITRCWFEKKVVSSVRARDYRPPKQPAATKTKTPWGMWVNVAYADGSDALIRGVGYAKTGREGHFFWIHGTDGTIRGSVLGSDFVELEKDGVLCRYEVEGHWFPDGFAGTMGELLCAIAEDREPFNSARHNLLSLQMTLAACESADRDGLPVTIKEAVS